MARIGQGFSASRGQGNARFGDLDFFRDSDFHGWVA
jgi:hypothetical protein